MAAAGDTDDFLGRQYICVPQVSTLGLNAQNGAAKRPGMPHTGEEKAINTSHYVASRDDYAWQSAQGDPDSPIRRPLVRFPAPEIDRMAVSAAPAARWVAGALGAGLVQAATAVSTRPDVGTVELSLAASAAAVGVNLYGQGVQRLLLEALASPDAERLLAASTALGGLAGAIIGTGLASTSWPPGQIAGVALLAGSTAAAHHALGQSFVAGEVRREQQAALARGEHRHQRDATIAMVAMAVVALGAGGYGVWAVSSLGAAEAAGLGLLCHALLGTAWSTRGVIRRWKEDETAARL